MKYKRKPIVVDAVQYDGKNKGEIIDFTNEYAFIDNYNDLIYVNQFGRAVIRKNDWVVKEINGVCSPCKPIIFKKTYEKVSE